MKLKKRQELVEMKCSFENAKQKQIEKERSEEQQIEGLRSRQIANSLLCIKTEFIRNKENDELKRKTALAEKRKKQAEEAERLTKLMEQQLKASNDEKEARISKMCREAVEQADQKSEEQERAKQAALVNLKSNWKQQLERKQQLADLQKQQDFEDIQVTLSTP